MTQLRDDVSPGVASAFSPLRQLRRERGLSLEAVGHLAGRDAATISRIERGLVQPNRSTVVGVARALGISVSRLRRLLEAQEDDRPERTA